MSRQNTILIVDDATENLHILMNLLQKDYKILAAKNGEQALKLAQRTTPPDLILLDIMMPGMDGYEVMRILQAGETTRDIPVIFITALGGEDDETLGLRMGATDYIRKPFNPAIVKARVKNHLALREATQLREDVERIMRHDLKSPLTAVISLPQLLLRADNLNAYQRDMLGRIEEAGYTLLSMINLSTALFKMERGIYSLAPEPMDMAELIRKVFSGFEDTSELCDTPLKLYIEDEPARAGSTFPVKAEELLCYSMLFNLIGNAMEASPEGEPIGVFLSAKPEGEISISIDNRGEVPENIRNRFFEKYATAGKTRGTGLGTYSARLIARAHGGDAMVESRDGRVRVTVALPDAAIKP